MRAYLAVLLLALAGASFAQDSLGVNARTRPRTRRLAPAYQEGQFIIANSALNGEWNDDIIYDGTYILVNGDTVLVSPLPPGLGTEWTLAGDAGTPQLIGDGDTGTIAGGTGITTTAGATGTVTVNWAAVLADLDNVTLTAPTPGQVLEFDGANWVNATDDTGGAGTYTFNLAADSGTPETVDDAETVTIVGGTGLTSTVSATNQVTIDWAAALADLSDVTITTPGNGQVLEYSGGTWVNGTDDVDDADADPGNELQTYAHSGTTSYTNTLSDGGGSFTLQATGIATISHSGGTVTIGATEVDGSVSNELQTYANTGTTSYTNTLSDGGGSFTLQATGIATISHSGGTVTIGATEVDGSTSNELQTYAHTGTTSYTNTLSDGGGSFTLQAGTNVTLGHTAGTVTINAAGDGTGMSTWDLTGDSGAAQTIDDGETVDIAGGTNITTVAGATNTLTINWAANIEDLTNVNTALASPSLNQVLKWDGDSWEFASDDTGAGGTMTNWIMSADSGSDQVVNDSETATWIGGTNITTTVAATNQITIDWAAALGDLSNVVLTAPSTGQVLEFDGTNWVNATDDTGAGADDDWRFSAGATWQDPAYREGLTSIFTTAATHGLRVDSTFQFNVEGGLAVLDWQDGSTGHSTFPGLFWEARGNTDGVGVGTIGGQSNIIIGGSTATDVGHTLGSYSWAGDDPNSPGSYIWGGGIRMQSDKAWTATQTATNIEFLVNQQNTLNKHVAAMIHSSGRFQLTQYGSFSDTNPDYLLGWNSASDYIQKFDLAGTRGENKILKYIGGAFTWADDETGTGSWTIDATGGDTEDMGGQTLLVAGAGIASTSYSSAANTLTITATEVDGSVSNELQTYANTGTTSYTNTLSNGGGSFTLQATGIATISHSGGTVTIGATEVDGSTSNELQTYAHSGTTSYTNTLSNGGGSFTLQAGTNVTLSHTAGTVTINAAGGGGGNTWSPSDRDTFTQAAHGFLADSIPIPVYNDGDGASPVWVKASNSAVGTLHDAFIVEVIDANTVAVQSSGFLEVTGHGFPSQADYFLGASGERKPGSQLGVTEINDWLFHAIDNNNLLLKDVRPYIPEGVAGGEGNFIDNVFSIVDDLDGTKELNFQLSGISAGTTRVLTVPNANGTIALTSDITDESWTIDADGGDTELADGQTILFAGSGIASTSYSSGTNTLTITATEVDGSVSNELQTYAHTGTTSYTNTLSNGGGSFTLQAGTNVTLSHTAGTVTINAAGGGGGDWTIDADGGDTEAISTQTVLFAGAGIASTSYSSGTNTLTITATEVDGSTSNELQTFDHTGTTSYTNTLSNGGGSFTLQAGTNVTLSHTAGTVTINSSGSTLTQEQVEDFAFDPARFGTGTRDGITVTYTDASNRVDFTVANAARMITGGADELNADQADIDWNPAKYVPGTAPAEATSVDHLTAHLYGIDQFLEYLEPDDAFSISNGSVNLGSEKNTSGTINMTGLSSITITLSNPVNGGAYILRFSNADDTDTVTWPGSVLYEDGSAVGTGILSDGRRMVQLWYDGTNYYIPGGY